MLARVLLMLGLVSASLAFSLHSQPTCCSPVEYEALLSASSALGSVKSSQSSSGRLAVDHQHRMAALYLMYPAMDMNLINFTGNATPFSHIADAARTYIHAIQRFVGENPELVLYIVHEQQQAQQPVQVSPVCKAFILPSIITELGQRCFSSPSQSFLDMIAPNNPATFAFRGTDPTELFAYEMYMSRQGCTPTQASLSSVVSSLEMNFLVSAVSPSISDRSIFNVPAPCAGVTPSRISYPSRGSSGPSSFVQQLVKLYALSQLRPHIQPRQQRSVGDKQQPSVVQDVESILAFEEMLTLVSTVLGDLQNELGGNRGPSFGGRNSPDIEDLIPILVKANILPQILGSVGGNNNQPSIQDIIDALFKSNLVSVGSNSPSVQSLIQTLVKKSLLPSDSSNTDTLVTLLIAENIISSRQEYDALQQLLAEAVALHVLVPHIIHVEMLYNSYQQQQQGPNYQQLMALMALLQGQQQQPSHHLPELIKHENDQSGPDYSQLLQMLLLQQYQASQSQSGGHLPAYIKHQNDNSGPDLSDLLKLLKISP